jgi:hypothetical protein
VIRGGLVNIFGFYLGAFRTVQIIEVLFWVWGGLLEGMLCGRHISRLVAMSRGDDYANVVRKILFQRV